MRNKKYGLDIFKKLRKKYGHDGTIFADANNLRKEGICPSQLISPMKTEGQTKK